MNEPFFAIEPEYLPQESNCQRHCVIRGMAWTPDPPRVLFRIIPQRPDKQMGNVREQCLRRGSRTAIARLIERAQQEKQSAGALDRQMNAAANVAPRTLGFHRQGVGQAPKVLAQLCILIAGQVAEDSDLSALGTNSKDHKSFASQSRNDYSGFTVFVV